jgi:predicted TIM-barrel fold metal-dependent hydrolase
VYVDTAATSLLYEPTIYRLVDQLLAPEHILFGSDFPLLSQRGQLRRLAEAPVDDHIRAMIRGGNAARLLRIE